MQDYRKLRVWQKAHALALMVRRASNRFPKTGFSDLKSQMTKAAESVPFNIVEGTGASTSKEFARFLGMSIKSSKELEYQLVLAHDYRILPVASWQHLTTETVNTRRMLCGLRKKVLETEDDAEPDENGDTPNGEADDEPNENGHTPNG